MDNKIKLFAVASVIAVITSGCTGYNNNQDSTGSSGYSSSGSSQSSGTGQVANNRQTCVPCSAKPKQTYTYKPRTVVKPKPRTTYTAPAKPTGQHNQQYYLDRWNRQQNQSRTRTVNTARNTTYGSGYYTPPNTASSTTYYDYSSAAQNKNTGSLVTSNKSIYTGSYQKRTYKPYKPTTYASGSSSSSSYKPVTYKPATYVAGTRSAGGSSYTVKKGDTVFEIMRQTGVYWKDIIRLNNLQAPYNISPGQRIRLK